MIKVNLTHIAFALLIIVLTLLLVRATHYQKVLSRSLQKKNTECLMYEDKLLSSCRERINDTVGYYESVIDSISTNTIRLNKQITYLESRNKALKEQMDRMYSDSTYKALNTLILYLKKSLNECSTILVDQKKI